MHKWNVVIEGIQSTANASKVESTLLNALKFPRSAVAAIKRSQEISVKNNIDHATAYGYKRKLEGCGLAVRLERYRPTTTLKVDNRVKAVARDDAEKLTQVSNPSNSTCPKCTRFSRSEIQCDQCGLVFSKYKSEDQTSENISPIAQITLAPKEESRNYNETAMDERMQRVKEQQQGPVNDDNGGAFPLLKLSVVALVLVCGVLFKLGFFESPDMTLIGDSPEAQASAQAQYDALKLISSAIDVGEYLADGRYQSLDNELLELQAKMMAEPKYETAYFNSIDRVSSATEQQLNAYVAEVGSALSYAIRGSWYLGKGYEARGTCFAHCVTKEQFETQRLMTLKGLPDLRKSIELDEQTIVVYKELIYASAVNGIRVDRRSVFRQGIVQFPGSYVLRASVMNYLRPRWGGSRASMKNFYRDQEDAVALNPRIYRLQGAVFGDIADTAQREKQWQVAASFYTKALEYGLSADWAYYKAYSLDQTVRAHEAVDVTSIAILEEALSYAQLAAVTYDLSHYHQLQKDIESHLSAVKKVVAINLVTG